MELQRVVYNLFESDAQVLDASPSAEFHQIDREIVLEGRQGERIYVSWEESPDADDPSVYRVACRGQSFFTPGVPVVRDYSEHELWQPLLETEIELSFRDADHRVLEIRGAGRSVFVCSYETGSWGADVLHISSAVPSSPA